MVSIPQIFPTKTLCTPLLFPIRATCPTHLILLHLTHQVMFSEQYRPLSSSLCSYLQSPVTSSLLGPNILLSTLFSNTLGRRYSFNVSDQVSHPYKTTGKIIVMYILIFKLHNEELRDLYSLPNIVRLVKSRRMRWAGHVERMGKGRGVHGVLVGKPEGKRPLGRHRGEHNIKMDLREVGGGCRLDGLGSGLDRWRALMNTLMNLRVP